jgi:perosamine synthetase
MRFEPGSAPDGFVPLSVPQIGGNAWSYVRDCLDSGWVSSAGSYVTLFEQKLAETLAAHHAVACASGTAALHLALLALGIGPGDEVILPALTFIAPANAVRYTGAMPVFVDIEPRYWQMDPARLAEFCERQCEWVSGTLRNRTTGRRVRAVLFVDVLGHPADAESIGAIARRFDLHTVEDATESLGAQYHGRPVGRSADLTCLSFNGNKVITTGGGGAIVTDSTQWAEQCRHLSTQAKLDPIEYVHDRLGYNYRLTNLQAALGVAQLEQLDQHVAAKRRIARIYSTELHAIAGVRLMEEAAWAQSAFWLYTVQIDPARYGRDSRDLLRCLTEDRIQTRPLWQPLHQSAVHAEAFCAGAPVAEHVAATALSLPSSVGLPAVDQYRVIERVAAHCRC